MEKNVVFFTQQEAEEIKDMFKKNDYFFSFAEVEIYVNKNRRNLGEIYMYF